VSHEIRTPLSAIVGLADLMALEPLPDEQREYVNLIRDQGRNLLDTATTILEVQRTAGGQLTLNERPHPLQRTVEAFAGPLRALARTKGIQFRWEVVPTRPAVVILDAGRLRQVLTNLVANAIRHTDRGEVCLVVTGDTSDPSQHTLEFRVTDTGSGIAEEDLPHLFDEFFQGKGSGRRRGGGAGLGLTISQLLVKQMGGEIRVETELGRGSSFEFTIPTQLLGRFSPENSNARPEVPVPLLRPDTRPGAGVPEPADDKESAETSGTEARPDHLN